MTKTIQQLLNEAGVSNYDPRANKVQITRRPLYCRRILASALAVIDGTKVDFFHKGIGDDLANFGGTAGTPAGRLQTNLQPEGRLAPGELFICTGIAFQLPHDVSVADYAILAESTISWVENAETAKKVLGQFEDFPPQVAPSYIVQDQNTSASAATQRLVRSSGRAYMSDSPLFYIRGGVAQHDQGKLQLEFSSAGTFSTLTGGHAVKAKLYGVYFQKLGA